MAVHPGEIECYEYINAIKNIEKYSGQGVYGLDNYREKTHTKLCEIFNLSKEQTLQFTNNLDLNDYKCAENLFLNLLVESRKINIPDKQ